MKFFSLFRCVKTNRRSIQQPQICCSIFSLCDSDLFFLSIRVFFHGHWRLTEHSTRSRIFRLSFATFHVWWLSHIFNRTACIYQTTTRLDLPPHRITIWLIDDVTLVFVCLRDDWIWFFVTAIWDGKPVNSNSHRLSPLYYKRTD